MFSKVPKLIEKQNPLSFFDNFSKKIELTKNEIKIENALQYAIYVSVFSELR
jgi:hypothetical protein